MPFRYKIDYQWDKPIKFKGLKQRRDNVTNRLAQISGRFRSTGRHRLSPILSDGGRESEEEGERGSSAKAREKLVMPAGNTLVYTPGAGTPLLPPDPFRQGRKSRPRLKGLGVVDPVCSTHSEVEKEYAIIREVVEVYLETKAVGGIEGSKCPLTSPTPQEQELQDDIESSCDSEDFDVGLPHVNTPISPPTKHSQYGLFPVTKLLQPGQLTSQRFFFMEGKGFDLGRVEEKVERSAERLPPVNPTHAPVDSFQEQPTEDVLTVVKKPLSSRFDNEKKELERGFNLIRKVNERYPDPMQQIRLGLKPIRQLIPHHLLPLEVTSKKSPIRDHCTKFDSRHVAGLTPKSTYRLDKEVALNGKPPSPTFELKGLGSLARGKLLFWKPIVSRRGYDPYTPPPNKLEEGVEGQSLVTRMPSKVILNIVLPRAGKSRESRLCGRQLSNMGQNPMQAWLSNIQSRPRPPPKSAPASTQTETQDDSYTLPQTTSESGDKVTGDSNRETNAKSDTVSRSLTHDSHFLVASHTEKTSKLSTSESDQDTDKIINVSKNTLPDGNPVPDTPNCSVATSSQASFSEEKAPQTPKRRGKVSSAKKKRKAVMSPLDTREDSPDPMSPYLQEIGESVQEVMSSCRRAAHCDIFGPNLCTDCEAAVRRRQFTAKQEFYFPQIQVSPRYMVATQKFKASKGDQSHSPIMKSVSARWPYAPFARLNSVVTDSELCKRIVEKGHRAKMPAS